VVDIVVVSENPIPMNADPAAAKLTRRIYRVESATPENIAPFGGLIGPRAAVQPSGVSYYAGAVATGRQVDYQCDTATEISLATLHRRPLEVHYMERHAQHTQTFIPLGNKPFMAILAPPCDGEMPEFDKIKAFRFEGDTGLCLHRGTWHEFPFPLEDDTHIIVALSSQTSHDLQQRAPNGIEAFGPDLDKKDITLRAGLCLVLEL
jgi:ureidoglycolate lyase